MTAARKFGCIAALAALISLPGCLSLPHGFGMKYPAPDEPDTLRPNGPSVNELTDASRCDPLARTPHHKFVPVRLSVL